VRIVGYRTTDACGNINTTTRFVTITVTDTEAPEWEGADLELAASCTEDIEVLVASHVPSATDNCSAVDVSVTSDVVESGACAGEYVRIVGYQTSDACGNTSTTTRFVTITVTDTEAPEWEGSDFALAASCTDDIESLIASNIPSAHDNCSVLATVVTSDVTEPGECAGNYVRIVGYQVADACGNINTTTRFVTISVTDSAAPDWESGNLELAAS
jgi:hypothetical protein